MIHRATARQVTAVDAGLRTAMLDCWVDVTDAGGAVGFLPPADRDEVGESLDRAVAEVAEGRRLLVVAEDDDGLAGFGFVVPQTGPVVGHRGTVLSLQVHPSRQGRGVGRALVDALHDAARGAGLTQLTLFHREGLGLGAFYEAVGYREVGRWASTLRVADDDWRDDVWMAKDL